MTEIASPRIAFVGLGVMGLPMARNIQAAGFNLTTYDVAAPARVRADAEGLTVASELAPLLETSEVIVAMLPDTPDVENIVYDTSGLLARAKPGAIFVDMSSISPLAEVAIGERLAERGIQMIDAPVSGGFQKAISGELSIMAGGEEETLDAVAPILASMGSVTRMGSIGAGQATKVCNQVAVTLTIQAACEAFALGAKLGVDLELLRQALLGGSCASWILENMAPQILSRDDKPGFRIALQVKDLRIAADSAARTNTPLPGLSTVLSLYTEALVHGQANDGNQALARVYERMTGATIEAAHVPGVEAAREPPA